MFQSKSIIERNQRGTQAQIMKEWLVIHCSLGLLFYAAQDHCPRSSTTYSQLGPPTSNINQENVLQPSLMGHLSVEVPSFQMTQLVSSTVMCFQAILLSLCHSWGKENTGKEEEMCSEGQKLYCFGTCPWDNYQMPRMPQTTQDATGPTELRLYSKRWRVSSCLWPHGKSWEWTEWLKWSKLKGKIPGTRTRTFQYLGSKEDRRAEERIQERR